MRYRLLLGIAAVALAGAARPDWNPGDPYKWLQPPDPNGYDVLSTAGLYPSPPLPTPLPVNKLVADDFRCMDGRPITDIHVWGSWWIDSPVPGPVLFQLSIWSDVPAGPGSLYSHPGNLLWQTQMVPAARIWGTGNETFYDPNAVLPPSPEAIIWQYNFILPSSQWFNQELGKVYWLGVQALNVPVGHLWGWKTSTDHWNDDAAWVDDPSSGSGSWNELLIGGTSRDMAFVITTPEPATIYGAAFLLGFAGLRGYRRHRGA